MSLPGDMLRLVIVLLALCLAVAGDGLGTTSEIRPRPPISQKVNKMLREQLLAHPLDSIRPLLFTEGLEDALHIEDTQTNTSPCPKEQGLFELDEGSPKPDFFMIGLNMASFKEIVSLMC
jgi:hypothetical protein